MPRPKKKDLPASPAPASTEAPTLAPGQKLTQDALERHLWSAAKVRGRDSGLLLLRWKAMTETLRPQSGEAVRRIVTLWAKRAGIKAAVRPHGLRHAAATYVAQKASLAELMALGGWASMSAARRYLDAHAADRQKPLAILELWGRHWGLAADPLGRLGLQRKDSLLPARLV